MDTGKIRNMPILLSVCIFLALTSACRQSVSPNNSGSGAIALTICAGSLDAEIGERVRTFAQRELRVPIAIGDQPLSGETLADCLDRTVADMPNRGPITIAVCDCPADPEHILIDPARGVSAINTAALKCADDERFARRVERLVMRSAATLAGLGFDPDPFCVMHSYDTVEDLDRMGRNLSPPWQQKFIEAAKEIGLETTEIDGGGRNNSSSQTGNTR